MCVCVCVYIYIYIFFFFFPHLFLLLFLSCWRCGWLCFSQMTTAVFLVPQMLPELATLISRSEVYFPVWSCVALLAVPVSRTRGFRGGAVVKDLPANAGGAWDECLIPGSRRSPVFLPGKVHGQRSCQGTVHRVIKSWTQLRDKGRVTLQGLQTQVTGGSPALGCLFCRCHSRLSLSSLSGLSQRSPLESCHHSLRRSRSRAILCRAAFSQQLQPSSPSRSQQPRPDMGMSLQMISHPSLLPRPQLSRSRACSPCCALFYFLIPECMSLINCFTPLQFGVICYVALETGT